MEVTQTVIHEKESLVALMQHELVTDCTVQDFDQIPKTTKARRFRSAAIDFGRNLIALCQPQRLIRKYQK